MAAIQKPLQRVMQNLYYIRTESDADKHRYGGLSRIICFNPPHPRNSRAILSLRKTSAKADELAKMAEM